MSYHYWMKHFSTQQHALSTRFPCLPPSPAPDRHQVPCLITPARRQQVISHMWMKPPSLLPIPTRPTHDEHSGGDFALSHGIRNFTLSIHNQDRLQLLFQLLTQPKTFLQLSALASPELKCHLGVEEAESRIMCPVSGSCCSPGWALPSPSSALSQPAQLCLDWGACREAADGQSWSSFCLSKQIALMWKPVMDCTRYVLHWETATAPGVPSPPSMQGPGLQVGNLREGKVAPVPTLTFPGPVFRHSSACRGPGVTDLGMGKDPQGHRAVWPLLWSHRKPVAETNQPYFQTTNLIHEAVQKVGTLCPSQPMESAITSQTEQNTFNWRSVFVGPCPSISTQTK